MSSRSQSLSLTSSMTVLSCLLVLSACGGGGATDTGSTNLLTIVSAASATNPVPSSAGRAGPARDGTTTVVVATLSAGSTAASATPDTAVTAPVAEPALAQSPYLRTIHVDASNAAAMDLGSGTTALPYRTIGAAMKNLRPGDDVVVAAGTYRESIVVPALSWGTAQTRIRAQTPHTVTIKGSSEVTRWTAMSGGVYWTDWTGEEPEQVFRNGAGLQQIGGTVFGGYPNDPSNSLASAHAGEGGIWLGRINGNASSLSADSFYYDAAAQRLYVKLASALTAGEAIEVSARRHVLQAESVSGLTVQGLDFAHSNTSVVYRWGALKVVGSKNLLNDLVVKDMDGLCVQLVGDDNTLSGSVIERCGQLGLKGEGARVTIADNKITHANTRGFNKWWEAGGMKMVGNGPLQDSVIRNNLVAYNNGDGIWVDWMNSNNLIEGNITAYNEGFGIHYEASRSAVIRANVSYGNAMRGIYLLESSDSTVSGNSVFGNVMEGIVVADGDRSAAYPALKPFNNTVTGNSIAWNDYYRNWVQLVLPGKSFGSVSNRNSLKAEMLLGRMSLGFASGLNPAFVKLAAWTTATSQDADSVEQLLAMPAALKQAIADKRLLQASELPGFLASPGTY